MTEEDNQIYQSYMGGAHYVDIASERGISVKDVLDSIQRVNDTIRGVDRRV